MKISKRLLILFIVAALVLSMVSCAKKAEQTPTAAPTEQTNVDNNTNEDAEPEATPDYSEPMTITFGSIQITEGRDYNDGDDMTKYFRDKFNIEWDIISLTWENWAEKLRIWINSGDMPDMATWNFNYSEAMNYSEQELIRKLPDDWKDRWPNAAKAYEDSVLGPALEEKTEGTFMLPKPIFSANKPTDKIISHFTLYLRKDWANAVGFEIKDSYTPQELLDYAQLVKEQDPGNVGSKLLPLSFRPANAALAFVETSNVNYNRFYKGEDGQYHWGPADESTIEGLKVYQQAYQEGLLNPDFFSLTEANDYEQFRTTGVSGAVYGEGVASVLYIFGQYMEQNLSLNPDDALQCSYLTGSDGLYRWPESINFWTCTIFSPTMEEAKFERIMDMIDYAATDEGQLLIRMGFEGTDYEYGDDGELVSLVPEGQSLYDVYPSLVPIYINMVILSDDFSLVNPATPKKYRDRTIELYQSKEAHGNEETIPSIDWDLYFYDSDAMRKVSFDFGDEYARLILMDGDLETNWRAWVEENSAIVNPVLEELNSMN